MTMTWEGAAMSAVDNTLPTAVSRQAVQLSVGMMALINLSPNSSNMAEVEQRSSQSETFAAVYRSLSVRGLPSEAGLAQSRWQSEQRIEGALPLCRPPSILVTGLSALAKKDPYRLGAIQSRYS
jgi:hypothetical protein